MVTPRSWTIGLTEAKSLWGNAPAAAGTNPSMRPRPLRNVILLLAATGLVTACPGDDGVGDTDDPPECADIVLQYSHNTPQSGELCPFAVGGIGIPGVGGSLMGDREFAGNGPLIEIDVQASIVDDGTRIEAEISYSATEIGGDTVLQQTFTRTLYDAPEGFTIASIDSDASSHIEAESPDGGFQLGDCTDGPTVPAADITITGGLVASVSMVGDTDGPDVSDDDECTCDTHVDTILFNDLDLTLVAPSTDPLCSDPDDPPPPPPPPGADCGEPCATDDDCASDSCVMGLCASDCTEGESCTVPGASGVCAAGTTVCNGCDTACNPNTAPSDETCDGLDNDCDGSVDEQLGGNDCTVTPDDCGLEVTGQTVCSGGELTCEAEVGVDYCLICGGECGACFGGCIPGVLDCAPGFFCQDDATTPIATCTPIPGCTPPSCWLPSDLAPNYDC